MRPTLLPCKEPSLRLVAAAVLLLTSTVCAWEGPRNLHCPPSIVKDVPVACHDSGSVLAGRNVTYLFLIDPASEPVDLVLTLHTYNGDSDLLVDLPTGQQLVSRHGSGEDVVFIPRAKVVAGKYVATVLGAGNHSSYKLLVEKHVRQRSLAAADRQALQQVLDSPCCAHPVSCTSLRSGLAPPAAAAGTPSQDLCNTGQNLCDPQGHLLHLALVNEHLSCPFPAEPLAALTHLTLLDLTMNNLTGSLDRDVVLALKQMPDLHNLLLSHNKLGGSLTCDLATASLAELGLAANQLLGGIPACIVESPALQELYLGSNNLEGPLPQPPPGSKLLIISAHGMRLNGTIPDLSALPQLQALLLQSNQFSGGLPAMPPAMRHLDLEYNQLSGGIPQQWAELADLEVLRLRHNALTGSLVPGLVQQPNLELLLLAHNRLAGPLPQAWQAHSLQRLDLQHNGFTGALPAALGALPGLAVLQLGGNRLEGSLEAFAQAVSSAPGGSQLQLLDLKANELTGPVPAELQHLGLFATDGGFTLVDDIVVPDSLDLSANQLSGPFPTWVVQALVDTKVVISMEDNSLACPANPIPLSEELSYNRMLGLQCLAADGSMQLLSKFELLLQPATDPAPLAGGGSDSGGASPGGGSSPGGAGGGGGSSPGGAGGGGGSSPGGAGGGGGSSPGGAGGGGGSLPSSSSGSSLLGWGITLVVLGCLAAVAGPLLYHRLQLATSLRYESYQPVSLGNASAAAITAKQQAVALAELGGSLPRKHNSDGGLLGAWGNASPVATSADGASSSSAAALDPFQIGTKVHRPEDNLV